jgi:uracil-DNA glycosylase family 4
MSIKFKKLNKTIIKCKKCPRLVKFIKKVSVNKRKKNINDAYWGKPVAGFGDTNAKLLILGLAPAAHGGTRTGRAFTGDKSGDFLFKCLYENKISNKPISINLKDGLELKSTYITNIIKCVPPDDKPFANEINNCSVFLHNEIYHLDKIKIIITLGKIAFDNFIKFYKKKHQLNKKFTFTHGKKFDLPDGKIVFSCYHPSPRNVNTGLLNEYKMKKLLDKVKLFL